jgi:hypothetical protein
MKLVPPEIKTARQTEALCQLSYEAEASTGLEPASLSPKEK